MSTPLGVAVIGSGRAGMIHAKSFARMVDDARLVALADPDPGNLSQAAQELRVERTYADHTQLLEDPAVDAVVIVTPTRFHRQIVLDAAHAGKHVFCEKPMAMTAEECADMVRATQQAGVALQIGYMRRFDASFQRAKEMIDAGAIGEVVRVSSRTHGPSIPQPWMYDLTASNGPLAEVSSHDIDTLRWLSGTEVAEVHAVAGNYRSAEAREQWPDFYDTVLMTSRMANGTIGCVEGAQGVRYGYDARVEVLGTDGQIDVGDLKANRVVLHQREGRSEADFVPSWRNLFHDAYIAEDRDFVEAIRSGTEPRVTGVDGLRAVEIVDAGNESIRTGQVVTLEPIEL
ncbi:Gfo/Idh/MocA family oxidoreductase [Luteococcus peritonei]|uniref:Gfo/Idh/MocA family oxidoreductase n=1 Tax=Luteococcus peritonei TaxID=88874 RepID=A0ABW4RWN1_9ACTN